MSEDWIVVLADDLERRLMNPMKSRLTLSEEVAALGRDVAERVRRETREELKTEHDELRNLLKIAAHQLDALRLRVMRRRTTT